jgi:3-hydroxy-9,10-secoandrosta-1,3,5(10)-triene-9,17-dione monooxygenase
MSGVEQGVTIPVPEPDLTPQDMIARARALRPRLREEQAETEERGHHSEELEQQFRAAGFYRALQPRRFGGYELDLGTWYRVVIELCRGCPSAGWGVTLPAGHPLQLGSLFSERVQAECFGPVGDFRAPSRATAPGTATRTDDGWVVKGTWDYCSGAPYSTHFMPVVTIPGDPPELAYAVIPRSGYEVLDDWRGMLGMRGSGSNSITVDAVVPSDYVVHYNLMDLDVSGGTPGLRLHGNSMYAGRALGFFDLELIAMAVGITRAALDEYEEIIRTRQTYAPPFVPRYQHHDFQRAHGLAMGMVAAAEGAVLHGADLYHEYARRTAEGGEPFSQEEDIQLFAQAQHANRLCWEAVELLFRTAGSSAAKDGQRMQRYYRDMTIIRGHFSQQYEGLAQSLSRLHFGLPF